MVVQIFMVTILNDLSRPGVREDHSTNRKTLEVKKIAAILLHQFCPR
jgi:hypothetical protein